MEHERDHQELLAELLETQQLAVLGTQHAEGPYTSLVGFAATPDHRHLLFATGRATRKHENLTSDARASMLIDNRTNQARDFTQASAATALGTVETIGEEQRAELERLFLAKHPHLESFVRSPSSALLRLRVSVYLVVTHFQHVIELHVDA